MFLLFICLLSNAVAWDAESHRVTARITSKLLSGRAKSFLYDHIVDERFPSVSKAIAEVSSWADTVAREIYPQTRQLHFSFTEHRQCRSFDFEKDCGVEGTKECIVTGIAKFISEAGDKSISASQRADAIKFLIHLIADAHHPLHIGFREDYGGNGIDIRLKKPVQSERDLPSNLHQVWDGYLLEVFRAENQGLSWWELGNKLSSDEPDKERFNMPSLTSTQTGYEFAVDIVSETATEVTCKLAYTDEFGRYIERNDELSRAYIDRGLNVMKVQLVKAAVRLAQALNLLASTYYSATDPELMSTAPTNLFEALGEETYDATEVAYFVDAESGDELGTLCETTPEDPAPLRNTAPIRRKVADKIDWDEVVLLRRPCGLYVTYRNFVTSDLFKPERLVAARVWFDREVSREIMFDSSMLDPIRNGLTMDLLTELVRRVYRLPALDPIEGVPEEGMRVEAIYNRFDSLVQEISTTFPTKGPGVVTIDFKAKFASVASLINSRPTREQLVRQFGEQILGKTEDQINIRLFLSIPDLVILNLHAITLVTTETYLKDPSGRPWAFHAHAIGISEMYLVDVRLLDLTITASTVDFFDKFKVGRNNKERSERVFNGHCPVLSGLISIAVSILTKGIDLENQINIRSIFESIEDVREPGRTGIYKFNVRSATNRLKVQRALVANK